MLRDACFLLCYIKTSPNDFDSFIIGRMGMSGTLFVYRDVFMLENQIPLWFIKFIFSLTHDDGDGDKFRTLLCNYLAAGLLGECRVMPLPWEEEPLHLLEAIILISLAQDPSDTGRKSEITVSVSCSTRKGSKCAFESASSPFGSATDLKAKGIHLRPSSCCLQDITFDSPKLHLPIFMVTNNTQVFFSNAIAFEMSPGTPTDFSITSYVMFMKTLIGEAKDAKELREKGILFNCLGSDEELVRVFQGVDTHGFCNEDLFLDVKMSIEKHCNSKANTWMAELLSTYFRSPWTAIALFAAILILSLTFIQTYYTINHSP